MSAGRPGEAALIAGASERAAGAGPHLTPGTSAPPAGLACDLPLIVLDTNALLDWVVFRDPVAAPLEAALRAGRLRWIASPAMATEWHHVWPRSVFARWQPDAARTQAVFEQAHLVPEPPRGPLRCKDPDDQVFIDLALQHRARWLISKDAALLKLARRARLLGVEVMTFTAWAARLSAADAAAATGEPIAEAAA